MRLAITRPSNTNWALPATSAMSTRLTLDALASTGRNSRMKYGIRRLARIFMVLFPDK